MPGLDPGIHVFLSEAKTWMAGTSPAMTENMVLSVITHSVLDIAGVSLVADLDGALFWEEQSLLVVSDLHLEKGSSFAARDVLLRGARADAATGLLDLKRLGDMLARIQGRITHRELDHVSPLAVPVMLEIGRESVYGEAADELLAEAADELIKEAME